MNVLVCPSLGAQEENQPGIRAASHVAGGPPVQGTTKTEARWWDVMDMWEEGSEQQTAWLWHQEERLALGDRASSASLGCLGEAGREGGVTKVLEVG